MRDIGTIRSVSTENGIVRLTVNVHGENVEDVAVATPARVTAVDLKPGDRVFIEEPAGDDAERIAVPYHLLSDASEFTISVGDFRIIITTSGVEIRTADGTAVPLALKSDVQGLIDAISNAATGSADGGALFKTNILTGAAGLPAGTEVLNAE